MSKKQQQPNDRSFYHPPKESRVESIFHPLFSFSFFLSFSPPPPPPHPPSHVLLSQLGNKRQAYLTRRSQFKEEKADGGWVGGGDEREGGLRTPWKIRRDAGSWVCISVTGCCRSHCDLLSVPALRGLIHVAQLASRIVT